MKALRTVLLIVLALWVALPIGHALAEEGSHETSASVCSSSAPESSSQGACHDGANHHCCHSPVAIRPPLNGRIAPAQTAPAFGAYSFSLSCATLEGPFQPPKA